MAARKGKLAASKIEQAVRVKKAPKQALAAKPADVAVAAPRAAVEAAASAVEQPVQQNEVPMGEVAETTGNATVAAVQFIAETVAEGSEQMTIENIEQVQEAQKAAADRIQAVAAEATEQTKVALEKGVKIVEELTDLTKGNVEALVASSKVAARGVEELSREAADYSRRSFEEASAALKSFAEVRSPTDFFKLQSDFARSAFDSFVSETSKVSEQVIKLAGEVAEPITSRYSVAAERVKTLAL